MDPGNLTLVHVPHSRQSETQTIERRSQMNSSFVRQPPTVMNWKCARCASPGQYNAGRRRVPIGEPAPCLRIDLFRVDFSVAERLLAACDYDHLTVVGGVAND